MRVICLLLSFASGTLVFQSCQVCSCKKVPCPAFNDPEFINWFPYTPDQKTIFRYNLLTDTITIGRLEKSEAYEAGKGCYHGDIGCNMRYHVYSQEMLSNYSYKFTVNFGSQTPFESSVTTRSFSLKFYTFICDANDINSEGLLLKPGIFSSHYYPSLNIAGSVYNNVQLIIKDTTNSSNKMAGPYKIYLAKNQGMIGYEDYPALRTWIKQ